MTTPPSSARSTARPGEPSARLVTRTGIVTGQDSRRVPGLHLRWGRADRAGGAGIGCGWSAGDGPGAAQVSSNMARGGGSSRTLEDRVGCIAVQVLRAIHDDDAPTALGWSQAEESGDVAGAVDNDLGTEPFALLVEFTGDGEQVGMGRLCDTAESRGLAGSFGSDRIGGEQLRARNGKPAWLCRSRRRR